MQKYGIIEIEVEDTVKVVAETIGVIVTSIGCMQGSPLPLLYHSIGKESSMNEVSRQSVEMDKLKKEKEKLIQENLQLMDSIDFLTQSLLWAVQAEDFQEGGKARKGWESISGRVELEINKIKKLKENKNYWNIR